ncbi:MAG: NAD-dependent epimerase/dehydratase family protein [Verrucomicrobia bacterium]|nr:NAD-dependent epimerase/dehydratase family protein [Verrucomicrobiota bacterium]
MSANADSPDLWAQLTSKRVLITGGLGFIGSNLARRLAAGGARVTVVDSLVPEYGGNMFNLADLEAEVRVNIADVRDPHSVSHLVRGQDFLFNLAGQTCHLDSMRDPHTDLEINCRAQLSILEACRKFNPALKIVFSSTRQIYGAPRYLPVDEAHALAPVDVNGVNKLAGENYHLVYHRVHGLRTCVLRLTNTYGPRMRVKDDRQTFLGIWFRRLLEGEPILIFGDGAQIRDFNYVDDVVDALLIAATDERAVGEVFNLGAPDFLSLKELAALLVELRDGQGEYRLVPFPGERRRIDIGSYYADYRRISERLGWQPRVSLREGLARTLDFYSQHQKHYWNDDAADA